MTLLLKKYLVNIMINFFILSSLVYLYYIILNVKVYDHLANNFNENFYKL